MIEQKNEYKAYVFYQKDQLVFKKIINNDEFFNKLSQDNFNNPDKITFFNYSELNLNKIRSNSNIDDIINSNSTVYNIIENLKNKVLQTDEHNSHKNTKSKIDINKSKNIFDKIDFNLKYLENILTKKEKFKNNDENNNLFTSINDKYTNLKENASNGQDNISNLSKNIYELLRTIKLIIETFNILQLLHYKIVTFFMKFIQLMIDFFSSQNDTEILSLSLESCLINQDKDLIIVFNQLSKTKNDQNAHQDQIKQFFLSILENYKKITVFPEKSDTNEVEKYFKNEILSFINQQTEQINKHFSSFSNYFEMMKNIQSKFQIQKKKLTQTATYFTFDESRTDYFWLLLQNHQNITKYTTIIDYIFNYYKKYVEIIPIVRIYDEFIKIYYKNKDYNKYTNLSYEMKQEKINQIMKEIQQTGKFFYLKIFTHIVYQKLINKNFFPPKIINTFPIVEEGEVKEYESDSEDNDENNTIFDFFYKKFDDQSYFKSAVYSSNGWLNKQFNFFLAVNYYSQNENKSDQKRELKIFKGEYSKFIVHKISRVQKFKVVIPFFSCRTLNDIFFINNSDSKKRKIEFSLVDKIVIILEAAIALNDLHNHNEFHGNISLHSLLMNSKKDVYLCDFSLCPEPTIGINTTPKDEYYYYSIEVIKKINKIEGYEIEYDRLKSDIYSFGVLMHAIITEIEPENRFKKYNRSERLKKLIENYSDFLFEGENNDFLNYNLVDEFGNSLFGLKEIIQKCMSVDEENRFNSFLEIINEIKSLLIYERNEEEIEYRIENAENSEDYKCDMAELVESYYLGQENCIDDIKNIIVEYFKLSSSELTFTSINDDLIKTIFDSFKLNENEDDYDYSSSLFNDIFDNIIKNYYINKIDRNKTIELDNKLFLLSTENSLKKIDSIEKLINFFIPISTLDDFMVNNQTQFENYKLKWCFLIARDLSEIHSKNIYHGELSTLTIGVYYDNLKQTFFPSIIFFYSFFKQTIFFQQSKPKKRKKHNSYSKEENIEYYQSKDIKNFIEIIQKFNIFSDEIFSEIKLLNSVDEISHYLYNYIINNFSNKEQELNDEYTPFCQLTYSSLKNVFQFFNEKNILLSNCFLNFDEILNEIDIFLENTISNPFGSILSNLLIKPNRNNNNEKTDKKFEIIGEKCSLILKLISFQFSIQADEIPDIITTKDGVSTICCQKKIDQKIEKKKFTYSPCNFTTQELSRDNSKKWLKNPIERKIEFSELCIRSVEFLFRRYIFNLNPSIKYRLVMRITNKLFSPYQDIAIKADDIIFVANELGYTDIKIKDGNIIIYIKPSVVNA